MKYSFLGVLALVGLSSCTTIPGAAIDAAQVGTAIVGGGVAVGTSVLDGASNAVVGIGRDVSAVVTGAVNAIVPPFYSFP